MKIRFSFIKMWLFSYKCLLFVLPLLIVALYAGEFVKKTPARKHRKEAQQRDIIAERYAKTADTLLARCLDVQHHCSKVASLLYSSLKTMATSDACFIDTVPLEQLSDAITKLEEIDAHMQKLEHNLPLCEKGLLGVLQTI